MYQLFQFKISSISIGIKETLNQACTYVITLQSLDLENYEIDQEYDVSI